MLQIICLHIIVLHIHISSPTGQLPPIVKDPDSIILTDDILSTSSSFLLYSGDADVDADFVTILVILAVIKKHSE